MESKFTFKEYKFPDGETIKCTVAFAMLLKLRAHNKKIYEQMNNSLLMGVKDMTEAVYVLYGAYLCACYAGENGGEENIMGESAFIEKIDDDLMNVMILCGEFLNVKKK